jgi:outer membrane protein
MFKEMMKFNSILFKGNQLMKTLYFTLFLSVVFSSSLNAQTELTPAMAIDILLKNNYSIQIARGDSAYLSAAATRGNAGMLPQVGLVVGGTAQNSSINQRFSNGIEVKTSGVTGNGLNARAELGWTLFDGGKMFTTYNRLKAEEQQGGAKLKLVIENELETVLIAYFDIIRKQEELKAKKVALDLFNEQVTIIEAKVVLGSASRQELLQSKVDRNSAKSAVLSQQLDLDNAKLELYRILAVNQDAEYLFPEQKESVFNQNIEEIKRNAESGNSQLLIAKNDKRLQEFRLKETKADRSPVLNLSATYGFTRTSSSAGFALFNQSAGPNAGLTLSWNLYNGSQLNSQIRQSNILLEQTDFIIKQQTDLVNTQISIAYKQWLQSNEILNLETENLSAAEENLNLATERLRVGQIGILPLKESQRSYQEAVSRKSIAAFQMNQAELALMRLSGQLLK